MQLIKKEFLFFIFFFLLLIFIFNKPNEIYNFNSYIDYPTIRALSVLLLLTTAMKLSNMFEFLSIKFIKFFNTEKSLALFFISLTSFLAMFLTNDITLFIIVPLTLAILNNLKNDITKLIVFEAIASNVGSLLTPIGNPQNLYLFRQWDISFINFIHTMTPIFLIKFSLLFIFTLIVFPNKNLETNQLSSPKIDKFLFISTFILFILYIIALEENFVKLLIPVIVMWYLIINKQVFLKFDYFLILTFILMFIDFNIIANFDIIKNIIDKIDLNFINVFNLSVFLSQIMSNVPSTIFVSQFSNNYQAIAYGANLAGSGIIISSLANIIAIRLLNQQQGYIIYHKYGIPYFLVSYFIILYYLY